MLHSVLFGYDYPLRGVKTTNNITYIETQMEKWCTSISSGFTHIHFVTYILLRFDFYLFSYT